ncbi:hypothetical protein Cgig2_014960 [Carnegiea gigantea]|uniref:Uncharacterized protein n=1 Tax=Carnegiea gigantea TaxID=171969 RepID=A0A9Q1JH17_9CARY|nr:hypothetical protein Cgig2_014960 [Carnegiea gigantea]
MPLGYSTGKRAIIKIKKQLSSFNKSCRHRALKDSHLQLIFSLADFFKATHSNMEPNPERRKQIQSYVPTIQDFAIKPESQIQSQTHPMHPKMKIQNQYESLTRKVSFLKLIHSKILDSMSVAFLTPNRLESSIFKMIKKKSLQTLKLKTLALFFSQQNLFLEVGTLKNCRFYVLILIDTKSARTEHIKDDKGKVLYSKF